MKYITVIRTSDVTIAGTIPVRSGPGDLAVMPDGRLIYVTTGEDNVAVISTSDSTTVGTIQLRGSPTGIAVAPDGMHVYVANAGGHCVSVLGY
jgi:DNA-binding beta-propeller fold protein YncE